MSPILACVLAAIAVGVVAVLALRRARARGAIATRNAACELCGARGPVLAVRYHQNTGMLFMRRHRALEALACRGCSAHWFAKMTLHNLVLGWWGTISFVLTPLFIVNNVGYVLASLTLPDGAALAAQALEAQREYARNLLATKDEATVVDVLVRSSGATPSEVRAFIRRLRSAA
jgi:hypothetical protein